MLHIILMILKIIGILLLVLLGILLFVVLLILFVPIRYRLNAAFDKKPEGSVQVTWLLGAISARVSYDGAISTRFRLLWFSPFQDKVAASEEEEELLHAAELTGEEDSSQEETSFQESDSCQGKDSFQEEDDSQKEEDSFQEEDGSQKEEDSSREEDGSQKGDGCQEEDSFQETDGFQKEDGSQEEDRFREEAIFQEKPGNKKERETEPVHKKDTREKKKFKERIGNFIQSIREKGKTGQEWIERIRGILCDEGNQAAFRLVLARGKRLLRHILPQRIEGRLHFGFEDPYRTGQVLAAVSPFYGFYQKSLELIPDFENKALDGNIRIKGRLRASVFVWTAIRLAVSKNFRRLCKCLIRRGKPEKNKK